MASHFKRLRPVWAGLFHQEMGEGVRTLFYWLTALIAAPCALFALGAQPVGEQGEVGFTVAITTARFHHSLQLVFEHGLGVVQQTPDEGALAVVDRPSRSDAQR